MATALELENHALKPSPEFDARWKELTGKANDAFEKKRHRDAEAPYALACTISRSLFHISAICNGSQAERVVAMVVISTLNAARNLKALGRLDIMEKELENTAATITSTLQDKHSPPSLHKACAARLPHLFSEYKSLMVETDRNLSRFTRRFEEGRIAALSFRKSQTPST